jgi:Asp-tRNA(Asn)/Glu-tRNA(Gln) amidotransferase A subunit family amidase
MAEQQTTETVGHAPAVEHEPTVLGIFDPGAMVAIAMLAVFALFIWKKVPAAIGRALDDKIRLIREQLAEAEDLRKEAEALKAEYERKAKAVDKDRAALLERAKRSLDGFDALICPPVPTVPPPIDEVAADDDTYTRTNMLMLRNSTVINLLDGCAISVPMHHDGEPPTALMVAGLAGEDAAILRIAAWIEERL